MTDEEMTEEDMTEEDMTEEDIKKHVDAMMVEAWPEMQRYMREMRNKFLQESQEELRILGAKEKNMDSDGWWEHIPEDDETRHWLTGLYIAPPVNSKVVISKDHPSADPWMTKEGVFGVVLSVQPESTIILVDTEGNPIYGKDGKQVRMPGIPDVEVAFPENDYQGGLYLPADCLKLRENSNVPPENPVKPPC